MTIRQKFEVFSYDKGGIFVADREYINGSWQWNFVKFYDFSVDNAEIEGEIDILDVEDNELDVLSPFYVKENGQKRTFYPKRAELKKLCELMVINLSAFKEELCKLAGIKSDENKLDYTFVRVTIFADDFGIGEVRAIEYERMTEDGTVARSKELCFYDFELKRWFIRGYFSQKTEEQKWDVEKLYLYKDKTLLNGIFREKATLTNKDIEPFTEDLVLLFTVIQNEKFEDAEKILERISDLEPSQKAKRSLIYQSKDEKITVEVDDNSWCVTIGTTEKKGDDEEIVNTFRKLIKSAVEKGDDSKLLAFCEKIIKHRD